MKAAVISQGSVSSKWTLEEMRKLFDEVDDIDINKIEINLGRKEGEVLYDGKPLGKYDCIYAKGSFRYNPLLRAITACLCKGAYMPIKASAFTIGHDKLLTQLKLEQHNVPMPKTYLSSSVSAARKILEKINYPIVMKFPEGTQGKGVMFADSFASASSLLDALTALKQPFIIQEYVETGGVDIRTIIVGDKIVASMKRKAEAGEKRANIHAGGIGEACILEGGARKIAINTAKAIGAEICAVDILESVAGPVVLEVNLSPGLQGITKATGINAAREIAKYLYEQSRGKTETEKSEKAKEIMKEVEIERPESLRRVITTLDFRGDRILLPKEITKVMKIKDADEVELHAKDGVLFLKKYNTSDEKK